MATPVAQVLLAIALVLSASWGAGMLCRRIHQPVVIGELFAGVLLGPSLLGRVAPDLMRGIFPPSVLSGLSALAQLGLIFYMFLVGLEVDLRSVSTRMRAAVGISHASILLPAALGGGLALLIHARFAPRGVGLLPFGLFLALAMSITAFPVLARILKALGMSQSPTGSLALACAAIDDVTAWCLLAMVVAVSGAAGVSPMVTIGGSAAFIAVMIWGARPLLARWLSHPDGDEAEGTARLMPIALGVVAAAMATELIGIHALFGAFCLGVCMPRGAERVRMIESRLSGLLHAVLLPIFFALSGLRTQVGLVSGGEEWLILVAVVVLACAGKMGGTILAGRLSGMSFRDSAAVGVLMNTRGLMELIVLNVGLDLGILTPTLFTIFVLMALVTTAMAAPLFRWIALTDGQLQLR